MRDKELQIDVIEKATKTVRPLEAYLFCANKVWTAMTMGNFKETLLRTMSKHGR